MERKFKFSVGEYYHLYNRGVDKRSIFSGDYDKDRFMKTLYLANSDVPVRISEIPQGLPLRDIKKGNPIVSIGAYCLMPNHFHILIKEIQDEGISKFMNKLSTSHSMYFNKKNSRTGALFEDTYKAIHLDNDDYLKYIYAYIHLNPAKIIDPVWRENPDSDKIKIKKYISEYKYSSYKDYLELDREEKIILDKTDFPDYFSEDVDKENSVENMISYMDEWLNFNLNPQG